MSDEIIEELWQIKDSIAREHDYDTESLVAHFQIRQRSAVRMKTEPAIHPGEHLAEELRELDMSAASLARQIEVPASRITEILNGRRAITGDTALRLAHFFGCSRVFTQPSCRVARSSF